MEKLYIIVIEFFHLKKVVNSSFSDVLLRLYHNRYTWEQRRNPSASTADESGKTGFEEPNARSELKSEKLYSPSSSNSVASHLRVVLVFSPLGFFVECFELFQFNWCSLVIFILPLFRLLIVQFV